MNKIIFYNMNSCIVLNMFFFTSNSTHGVKRKAKSANIMVCILLVQEMMGLQSTFTCDCICFHKAKKGLGTTAT
jgi:hypothetical protein